MEMHERLLLENKAWSREKLEDDPQFFHRLESIQTPRFLWIGCSDSRVPANEITGTDPGEVFVQRNIANLVVNTDLNLLSVLQYAVEVLKVEHIIVCGHYGCGGVKAAMGHQNLGIINKWLRNIKDVYRLHDKELSAITDEERRLDRLVELNVIEQVLNLAKTSIIQTAWKSRKSPHLHGWVYRLNDGILHPLSSISPDSPIDPIFVYENL
jgi:carbonic anhydrase